MKLDAQGATTSTVIHYKVTDVEPITKREGLRYEFAPDNARVLISLASPTVSSASRNYFEMQIHVEGPRKLARGSLSPMRHSERYFTRDLEPDAAGTPLWIRDLAEFWRDAIRKGTVQAEIANELALRREAV